MKFVRNNVGKVLLARKQFSGLKSVRIESSVCQLYVALEIVKASTSYFCSVHEVAFYIYYNFNMNTVDIRLLSPTPTAKSQEVKHFSGISGFSFLGTLWV